jgi:hypothetical protein
MFNEYLKFETNPEVTKYRSKQQRIKLIRDSFKENANAEKVLLEEQYKP